MVKEVEKEENTPRKHRFMLRNPDWLDLPEPIATNIILEHLELIDYIRFSAVCKKWQSIQKEHRIRYSPYPPPLPLPFPWLRCRCCMYRTDEDRSMFFYLPDKQKSYNISFLKTGKICRTDFGHGWLLLQFGTEVFYPPVMHIFNPITGVQIKLPPISVAMLEHMSSFHTTHISSPPTNPNCTIFIVNDDGIAYLYRLNVNRGWKKFDCSKKGYGSSRMVFCSNKIYHMPIEIIDYMTCTLRSVHMIDTLHPDPVEQTIEMDCSEISAVLYNFDLVDFFGELVAIITEYKWATEVNYDNDKEFHVYRADFSTNKWVRMETLGDHAMFCSTSNIFALPAVEVGCKKNAIYFAGGPDGRGVAWRAFDLSTKDWMNGPPLSLPCSDCHSNHSLSWFLPTLDYLNVTKTNELATLT